MMVPKTQHSLAEGISKAIDEHLIQRLETARNFACTMKDVYLDVLAPEDGPLDEVTFAYILRELRDGLNHQHKNTSLWVAHYGKMLPPSVQVDAQKVASLFQALKTSMEEDLLIERKQRNAVKKNKKAPFKASPEVCAPSAPLPLEKFRN